MFFGWGLRLGRTGPAYAGFAFSPLALFAAGEQGAWFDPSDLTTLSQDSAGTTAVTGVEQPVGRMLDKSGRGNHATQPTAASRPILSARVNRYVGTTTLATQNVTTLATTYTLSFTGAGSITLSGTATGVFTAGTYSVVTTAGTLTSTVSGTVTNADIRVANEAVGSPSYQRVTTSTDYDTVGFPLYLRLDGVDDGMVTGSIDFTGTDKMSIFTGVRKLSDAATGVVAELSATVSTNNGSFTILAPRDSTFEYGVFWKGMFSAALGRIDDAAHAAPSSDVYTGRIDLSKTTQTEIARVRLDGADEVLNFENANLSNTGNFGNYPLYIGRRGGTSLPFNGNIYGLIIRGALTDDVTTVKVEKYLAGKTGVLI